MNAKILQRRTQSPPPTQPRLSNSAIPSLTSLTTALPPPPHGVSWHGTRVEPASSVLPMFWGCGCAAGRSCVYVRCCIRLLCVVARTRDGVRSGQIEPVRSNLRRNSKPILISLLGLAWFRAWHSALHPAYYSPWGHSTWFLFSILDILVRIAESNHLLHARRNI